MRHLGINLEIKHDNIKLDGTHRKLMNSSIARNYGVEIQNKPNRRTFIDYK